MQKIEDINNQYDLLEECGKGGFGLVMKAQDRNGNIVAIKTINKQKYDDKATKGTPLDLQEYAKQYYHTMIQNEVEIMQRINHENVLKLYHFHETKEDWFYVLEYCESDLNKYIFEKTNQNGFSEQEALSIFIPILKGLKAINDAGYVHRDLKTANILVTKDNIFKICDMGFSKPLSQMNGTQLGTNEYMAPEISEGSYYDYKVDIWALGCVLFQLIFARLPFSKGEHVKMFITRYCKKQDFDLDIVAQHSKDQTFIEKTKTLSPELKDLFKQFFKYDQNQRINYQQLNEHPALKNYLGQQSEEFQIDMKGILGKAQTETIKFDGQTGMISNAPILEKQKEANQNQGNDDMKPESSVLAFRGIGQCQESNVVSIPQNSNLNKDSEQNFDYPQSNFQIQMPGKQPENYDQSVVATRQNFGNMQQSNVNNSMFNSQFTGTQLSFVKVNNPNFLQSNVSLKESKFSKKQAIQDKFQTSMNSIGASEQEALEIEDKIQFELEKNEFLQSLVDRFQFCELFHHKQITLYFLLKASLFFTNDLLQKFKLKVNFLNLSQNQFKALTDIRYDDDIIQILEVEKVKYEQQLKQQFISAQDDLNDPSKKEYGVVVNQQIIDAIKPTLDTSDFESFKVGFRGFLEYEFKQIYNNESYGVEQLKFAFLLFIAMIRNRAFEFEGKPGTKNLFKYLYRYREKHIKNKCDFLKEFKNWFEEIDSQDIILKSINHMWNLVFKAK